jgi:hypothetical protein
MKQKTESPEGFDEFWSMYPRPVAKLAAMKAYKRALSHATSAEINQGAVRYASEREGKDDQYTAHPATWLNGGRWEDKVQANGNRQSLLGAIKRFENSLNRQGSSTDLFGIPPRRLC